MKLPFFNRHRYVEIKAYTDIKWYVDEIPVVLTKDIRPTHLNSKKLSSQEQRYESTFNGCQGRIAGLRNSLTIRNHCEYDIIANEQDWHAVVPKSNQVFSIEPSNDPIFRPRSINVARVKVPWLLETSNTKISYVLASHILNTTGLSIFSGVLTKDFIQSVNYFLGIPKQNVNYTVPFRHPVLQLFPLTDLPIHVVSEYNPEKYRELFTIGISRPKFSNAFAFKK